MLAMKRTKEEAYETTVDNTVCRIVTMMREYARTTPTDPDIKEAIYEMADRIEERDW